MLWKSGLMRSISGRICWRFTTLHRGCTMPGHSAAHPQDASCPSFAGWSRRMRDQVASDDARVQDGHLTRSKTPGIPDCPGAIQP